MNALDLKKGDIFLMKSYGGSKLTLVVDKVEHTSVDADYKCIKVSRMGKDNQGKWFSRGLSHAIFINRKTGRMLKGDFLSKIGEW